MIETIGKPNSERDELDFYATDPKAVEKLLQKENITSSSYILENSAGNGHITKVLRDEGFKVFTIDIIKRDFKLNKVCDYLKMNELFNFDYAIYNPPFKLITEFILHTFKFTNIQYVFGRIQLLETINRYEKLFKNNYLEKVMVFSERITTAKGGDDSLFGKNNSMCFAWFKFNKNNTNKTVLEWIK